MTTLKDENLPTTPYYVYEKLVLQKQCEMLRRIEVAEKTEVLYSLKANPNPHLVNEIVNNGLGCDISSEFELSIALKSQVNTHSIGCVGPHKSPALLESCLSNNIGFIAIESLDELHEISKLGIHSNSGTAILLRINPSIEISGGSMKMVGTASQFGFSESDISSALKLAKEYNIKISGIHMYATTRVLDADVFMNNIRAVIGHVDKLVIEYNIPTDVINLGGGFGIPYYKNESELELNEIVEELKQIQVKLIDKHSVKKIYFESGRYIVGTCGKAIIKVCTIKTSRDKTYAICDGGYNIFHGATAFGNLVRKPYLMKKMNTDYTGIQESAQQYSVVGPLCTPSDIINDKFFCDELNVGDYIEIDNVGAYSLTSSPGLFIGHGYPAEYLDDGIVYSKIGKEDTIDSMNRRYEVNELEKVNENAVNEELAVA